MSRSFASSALSKNSAYQPLSDFEEIRVLCLQPRSSGEAVKCNIKHVKLSRNPHYEALSYMWGPDDIMAIEIDGRVAEVRQNLWQALYHLRFDQGPRVLWVDAISINQQDTRERNHQVKQMGAIYARASRVVVWLGDTNPAMMRAMNFLSQSESQLLPTMKSNLIQHLHAKKVSLDLYLVDMKAILLHDYWNRLWIIQEVLLASEIFIQCGKESVPFTALHALIDGIKSYLSMVDHPRDFKSPSLLSKIVDSPLALLIFRRNELARQPNQLFTLYPLLYLSADHAKALCMDERDKIFGLCSLASFCCTNAVPVDYSLSFLEICDLLLAHHCVYHADEEDGAIRDSRFFQHAMKISSARYEIPHQSGEHKPLIGGDKSGRDHNNSSVAVRAFIQGRIVWMSPVLTSPIPPGDFHLPALSRLALDKLQYLYILLYTRLNDLLPVSTQLDLVRPMSTKETYEIRSRGPFLTPLDSISSSTWSAITKHITKQQAGNRRFVLQNLLVTGVDILNDEIWTISELPPNKMDNLEDVALQVFASIREAIPTIHRSNVRLAVEEMGSIYLVPINTEVRDLVCRFPRTDVTILARQVCEGNTSMAQCTMMGQGQELLLSQRMVNFPKSTDKTFFLKHKILPGLDHGSRAATHDVMLQLSLSMLKAISIDSVTPVMPEIRKYPWEKADWNDLKDKGIHVCDFLGEDCSCLTVADVVSGRCPLPARFPSAMDPRMTPDESSNAGG